jgi:phage tail sheath protein FI
MPGYTYPGVYRREIDEAPRFTAGVSTANLALVSSFKKGPVNTPVLVSSLGDAFKVFGEDTDLSFGPLTLRQYYANDGGNAYIVRVVGAGAAKSEGYFASKTVDDSQGNTVAGVNTLTGVDLGVEDIVADTFSLYFTDDIAVVGEILGAAVPASGTQAFTADKVSIVPGSVTINYVDGIATPQTLTDDGSGNLTGLGTATGTINYYTGAISISWGLADVTAGNVTMTYDYEPATFVAAEVMATGVSGQRVYAGRLANKHIVNPSVQVSWVDATATPRTATLDVGNAFTGDATGNLNIVTGEFELVITANPPVADASISIAYAYKTFLVSTSDEDGVITGPAGTGTLDAKAGILNFTSVAVTTAGNPIYVAFDARVQKHVARNEGVSGDDLSLEIVPDPNYLDAKTGNYTRYNVFVREKDSQGKPVVVEAFENITLDDVADTRHIAAVLNDQYTGSALIEMSAPSSAGLPTALAGKASSFVLLDVGNGTVRQTVAQIPGYFGPVVPTSIKITYSSGGIPRTITDDGSGQLIGDVDVGSTATVDYRTGRLIFTPSVAPDNLNEINLAAFHSTKESSVVSSLTGGNDGAAVTRSNVTDIALKGSKRGIYAFEDIDDLLIFAVPDFAGDRLAEAATIAYAEARQNSIVLVSPPQGASVSQAINYKQRTLASISDRGAMYYPWVKVTNPLNGRAITIPPHGHVAGVIARTDALKNVGQTPAGITYGLLNGILDYERNLSKEEVGRLTGVNINALWQPPNQPRCVWGGRTLQVGGSYRYLSNRRTIDYTSVSVQRSVWWAVFENNGPVLWARLSEQIRQFLRRGYIEGLYKGNSEDEAFFVQIDGRNNPTAVVEAGELIVDYGVATFKPAEFIILQHRQLRDGGT